jgi:hypothetical protein
VALAALPASYTTTRESLRSLACFVISPARKAATGRIGLQPTDGGFGTPAFGPDDRRVRVQGDALIVEAAGATLDRAPITTLTAAAELASVTLSADPGVGHDLPPFAPDIDLTVDAGASAALGAWYAFGASVFAALIADLRGGTTSDATIWPEHFDYAIDHQPAAGARLNIGFSPGDAGRPEPYVYAGPWDRAGLDDPFWNADFGAILDYADLLGAGDAVDTAAAFVRHGLHLLRS